MIVFGLNPVLEALRAGRVRALYLGERGGPRMRDVLALASKGRVTVHRVGRDALARRARGGVHQGVVADVEDVPGLGLADLLRGANGPPLLVVLDGVEDPHNLGAILRTADAAGVDGVVVQSRRSAALGGAAAKASAGAVAYVKIAEVVNIAQALEELKAAGVWTVGLAADAETTYHAVDFTLPTAVVLGGEETGLRRLVRQRCDRLAAIPMRGRIASLNVSVAAGIVLFEAVRQRRGP